jgi:predicted DNA-binding protein YlxM (UPF0122 family)
MPTTIEKTIRLNQLYDFYGCLLTEKQQGYFLHYFHDDYSLAEIADLLQVSRNAVYDQIRIAIEHLETYEEKLELFRKHQQRMDLIQKIKRKTDASIQEELDELERME